jgi:hypothetical protein
MVAAALLAEKITDGRRFIEQYVADGQIVQAAYWGRMSEDLPWYLHIITEDIDRGDPREAYRHAQESLSKLGATSWLRSSEIKLVSPQDRIASRSLVIRNRLIHAPELQSHPELASELGFTECYFYSPKYYQHRLPHSMTRDDVVKELARLMQIYPLPSENPIISLKNGERIIGFPLQIRKVRNAIVLVDFELLNGSQQTGVDLAEIDSVD